MSSSNPLVSCIMPTANRDKFIPLSIAYFNRQDYPNKQLVIIDDGDKSVEHLLPAQNDIKYKRLNKVCVTGEKRNIACAESDGEIIVHWDDDDWYASDWITHQANTLTSTGADIVGLSQFLLYSPAQRKWWKYIYPSVERPWVAGTSMVYKKKFWEIHPFKHVKIGEDNSFVWDGTPKVVSHNYINGVVAIMHMQNTSPKIPNSSRWRTIPPNNADSILGNDLLNY